MKDIFENEVHVGDLVYYRFTNQRTNIESYDQFLHDVANGIPLNYDLLFMGPVMYDMTHPIPMIEVKEKFGSVRLAEETTRVYPHHIILHDEKVYDSELQVLSIGDRIVFCNSTMNSARTMMTGTIDAFDGQAVHVTDVSKKNFPKHNHSAWLLPMLTTKISK